MRLSVRRGAFRALSLAISILAPLALCLVLWPSDARACSCREADVARSVDSATAVFLGKVASVAGRWKSAPGSDAGADPGAGWLVADFTFDIERSWKGAWHTTIQVSTSPQASACGFPFVVGQTYLVFGYAEAHPTRGVPELLTGLCNPNALASDATALVAALDAGGDVTDPNSPAGKELARVEPPKFSTAQGSATPVPRRPRAAPQDETGAAGGPLIGSNAPRSAAAPSPPRDTAPKSSCGTCVVGAASQPYGPLSAAILLLGLAAAIRRRSRIARGR